MKKSLIILILFLFAFPALAHQPSVVEGSAETEIKDPEVSKAFYAELKGEPAHYHFKAKDEFDLYVNILVPDIKSATKDYKAEVYKDDELLVTLDPDSMTWEKFNEPFGGDVYYMGPEYKAKGQPGEYEIIVSSPDNLGKYVLAVGEEESFPLSEIGRTMKELFGVKKYFEKPTIAVFQSPFIYGPAIFIVILIAVVVWLVLRRRKKKENKE